MAYDLDNLPLAELFEPVTSATAALTRVDERVARSPVGVGMIQRMHFYDSVTSMWLEGELVHLEDLVLHDSLMDTRLPSHALTVAHSILRLRRQVASRAAGWALSPAGIQHILGHEVEEIKKPQVVEELDEEKEQDKLLDDIDALLAHTDAVLAGIKKPKKKPVAKAIERDALINDEDWDEQERLQEWQDIFVKTENYPPMLRAAIMHDAWFSLDVMQGGGWMGRILTAAYLRQAGIALNHLPALSVGLRNKRPDDRRSPNRLTRLRTFLSAVIDGANSNLKEHDRLMLAREQMSLKTKGRRSNSRLPQLIEMVLQRPMISTAMVEKELKLTQAGALKLIAELNIREITGRNRFRAWGVL